MMSVKCVELIDEDIDLLTNHFADLINILNFF